MPIVSSAPRVTAAVRHEVTVTTLFSACREVVSVHVYDATLDLLCPKSPGGPVQQLSDTRLCRKSTAVSPPVVLSINFGLIST